MFQTRTETLDEAAPWKVKELLNFSLQLEWATAIRSKFVLLSLKKNDTCFTHSHTHVILPPLYQTHIYSPSQQMFLCQ